MSNALELLDSLLQSGMKNASADRLDYSLSEKGIAGRGGVLDEILGSAAKKDAVPAGGGGGLGGMLGSILGGSKNAKTGAMGAIAGALLGGGSKSIKGALTGGALAILGSIALQAMRNAGAKQGGGLQVDSTAKLSAGLRAPESDQEVQHLESVAQLIVKAMVNAAKADGRVDEAELKRILGNAEEDGVNAQAREFLSAELRKPMDTDGLVGAVSSPQVAAQVYAASLMAVELDTPQERQYLSDLASKLGLDDEVVQHIHNAVGLA